MSEDKAKAHGTTPWYVAAAVATLVSTDTSWRFFGEKLGITWEPERVALFAVLEIALFAAAWSMRAGVRRNGNPGTARFVAWSLAGASGYMAVDLAGPVSGGARVILGPVLAIVALHQALGIELKVSHGVRSGTWARIGRELRERALSRMGLADDQRDALTRTRQRAAVKAAEIATSAKPNMRKLRKLTVKAGPAYRGLILDTAATLKGLDKLVDMDMDNPWEPVREEPVRVPSVPRQRRASNAPTSGGPAIGWDVAKVVRLVQEGRASTDIQAAANVSAKIVQRVTRVVRAIASGAADVDIVRGDITGQYVATIRKAMEVSK